MTNADKTIIGIQNELNYKRCFQGVPDTQGIVFVFRYQHAQKLGERTLADVVYIGHSNNMQEHLTRTPFHNQYQDPKKRTEYTVGFSEQPDMSMEALEQCAYALIYHCKPRDNHEGKQDYKHPPVHIQYECRMGAIGSGIKKVNCDSADIRLP